MTEDTCRGQPAFWVKHWGAHCILLNEKKYTNKGVKLSTYINKHL